MSIGGLASGLDTAGIVDQLIAVEGNQQTLLKQRLSATQSQAAAFRAINTRFDGLRAAAEALTKPAAWTSVKAASSSTSVTATTLSGAVAGSISFSVDQVARAHSLVSATTWTATGTQTATDLDFGATSLDLVVGGVTTSVALDRDGSGTATLAEAAAAINAAGLGVTATAVKVSDTGYRLAITSTTTGDASAFTATGFTTATQGRNAQITVGDAATGYSMTSATNTFSDLVPGTTITVTKPETAVTVDVTPDPAAVAAKVESLVSAVNGLLDSIKSYTDAGSSAAALKGNATLRQLGTQVLDVLAFAVGGDGSASQIGLQLSKDGRYVFDKTVFTDKLTSDPALAQRMFSATTPTAGPDGDLATTADNGTSPVGIAAKLLSLAKSANDSTIGSLTVLAQGADSRAKDLQDSIDAWDRRLELRRATLTRQFTAMETALSTMQNQANWLTAQLGSLAGNTKKD
ncbi:flagellar filament capping protein FliD [Blastococcus sp. TML/M2B]|uniref:flagellar filament capping protein FliD n=1 Tax=Blastococcus sp. TML/M2B TaxID=2798727 RepID=UPI001F5B14AC|nr:flagellar filament capping protein FliD [Blastococcus sp. TML/M2B]